MIDQPNNDATEDPFDSIHTCMVAHSRDWGSHPRDAWLYGIVVGWEEHEGDNEALAELAEKHGWTPEDVARLRRLRRAFASASVICGSGS